jgi:dTDP-4-dehydrorhamnose 3,5-epimerase
MRVAATSLPGVLLLEPEVFADSRGFFFESYNRRVLTALGVDAKFVQDNHSRSVRNVLRGLHYQVRMPQGKLVRVVAGEIFDVVVDLRRSSPTFGKWESFQLSAASHGMLWVPGGLAHGFLAVSDAEVLYETTEYWAPEFERCIRWNDEHLAIHWPVDGAPVLSPKDSAGAAFRDAEVFA